MNPARKPSSALTRILLVDDNHYGNAARKTVLEEQGFLVESVLSGEEALAVYEQQRFDVVVTDLKMKEMTGLELIAKLRLSSVRPFLILLSGWAVCLGLTEESSGADAVLPKSNNEQEQLIRTIRQLLARRIRREPASAGKIPRAFVARSG